VELMIALRRVPQISFFIFTFDNISLKDSAAVPIKYAFLTLPRFSIISDNPPYFSIPPKIQKIFLND